MAEKNEQSKPLAFGIHSIDIDNHDNFPAEFTSPHRRKCIKYCGCSAAILLILVVTILVLMLTIFHVKEPLVKLNSVKIDGLDLLSSKTNFSHGLNLTFIADVSIKNPNVASFKFDNTTTNVCYDGSIVGEVRTPAGEARARRTLRMNVSVDVMVDKMVKMRRFESDLVAGVLPLSTYARISGKVKITDVIKRSVVVKMNCTMNVNVSSHAIQDRNCRRSVSL